MVSSSFSSESVIARVFAASPVPTTPPFSSPSPYPFFPSSSPYSHSHHSFSPLPSSPSFSPNSFLLFPSPLSSSSNFPPSSIPHSLFLHSSTTLSFSRHSSPPPASTSPSPLSFPLPDIPPDIAGEPVIFCEGVSISLSSKPVLSDVSFTCGAGEWLSVIGPNGAGKTTLLRALSGIVRPHHGEVRICGKEVGAISARQLARRVAVISQHPVVPPGVKVLDYVLLGRVPHLGFGLRHSDRDSLIAWELLERLQVEQFADVALSDLSGGERQRVVVARALAQETPVLLLDEPTSALDIRHQLEVLELIDGLRKERNLAVVSTAHDLGLAGKFADRLMLLADGKVAASGRPAEVLTQGIIEQYFGVRVEILSDGDGVALSVKRGDIG